MVIDVQQDLKLFTILSVSKQTTAFLMNPLNAFSRVSHLILSPHLLAIDRCLYASVAATADTSNASIVAHSAPGTPFHSLPHLICSSSGFLRN